MATPCGHLWRLRHWSPLQTVTTFLLQALHVGGSCREAVALALGQQTALAGPEAALPSADPSAYCGARRRVPLGVLRDGLGQIAALYRDRRLVELRFRDLKTTLGMDVLRGRSPDIVRKEIVIHLPAYNLIRGLMWQAAREQGRPLHRLSFAGTVSRLNAVMP